MSLSESTHKYFAFISYSRKDQSLAKQLHDTLTCFNLPSKLCQEYPQKPKNVRPVFRDVYNLKTGELKDALSQALKDSKYLIVICSENSANPNSKGKNWVDDEVKNFLSFSPKNKDRIIPILHRPRTFLQRLFRKPVPESNKCMPPALQTMGLRAFDVQVEGKSRVFSNVIATMLGLELDELWDRYGRFLRRKKRIQGTALIGSVLSLIGGGAFAYDYCVPKVEYYIDYAECYNLPHGIGELTEEETKTRFSHYKFTYQYYKLQSVETCNSYGELIDSCVQDSHRKMAAKIVFSEYNDKGHLTEALYYDKKGTLIARVRYPSLNEIVYKKTLGGQTMVTGLVDSLSQIKIDNENGTSLMERSTCFNANRYFVERDEKGRIKVEWAYAGEKQCCLNDDRVWGYSFTYDDFDRIKAIGYIDKHSKPMSSKGVYGKTFVYDGFYKTMEYTVDAGGIECPKIGEAHSRVVYVWENGNLKSETRQTSDGIPVFSSDIDAASIHYEYDDKNCSWIKAYTLNASGERVFSKKIGCHAMKLEYSRNEGRVAETMLCYDKDMNPIPVFGSVYAVQSTIHPEKRMSQITSYDKNNNIVSTQEIYYDEDWRLWYEIDKAKGLKTSYEYDENGDLRACYYSDAQNNPRSIDDGYAICKYSYSGLTGTVKSITFYDEKLNPFNDKNDVSGYYQDWSDDGRQRILTIYHVVDGKEKLKQKNVYLYDEDCYLKGVEYRDANANLKANSNGVAAVGIERNGDSVVIVWRNEDNEPLLQKKSLSDLLSLPKGSELIMSQNALNEEIEYYGERITQTRGKDGAVITEISFLDANNEVIVSKNGLSVGVILKFDPIYRVKNYAIQDEKGKKIYDYYDYTSAPSSGDLSRDPAGYARHLIVYNERGDLLNETYVNSENNLVNGPAGYAWHGFVYNERGDLLYETYVNSENNLVNGPAGYALHLFIYNEQGDLTNEIYRNSEDHFVNGPAGYARHRFVYNERGDLLNDQYRDQEHVIVNGPDGYAEHEIERDATGCVLSEQYYKKDGAHCDGPNGYALFKARYDSTGQVTDSVYSDVSLMTFNEKGKLIEVKYRDAHGNARGDFDGTYVKRFEWSVDGTQVLRVSNYDKDNNLMQ